MAKGKYKDWLSPEKLLKLEQWARRGLTDEQIAHNMGISSSTLYDWKTKYPEISETLQMGKNVIDDIVENALLRKVLGCRTTEVIRERIVDTGQKERHGAQVELTEREWEFAKTYFANKCCYCGSDDALTKDHVVPLNDGGVLVMSNVLPCCKSCNSSKKDHKMEEWYRRQGFYSAEREKKIEKYFELVKIYRELNKDNGELVVTKEIQREVLPDTSCLMFWLRNRRPKIWGNGSKSDVLLDDINTPVGIQNIMVNVINLVSAGELDSKSANAIISAGATALNAIRVDEQQKKIDELERILNEGRQLDG